MRWGRNWRPVHHTTARLGNESALFIYLREWSETLEGSALAKSASARCIPDGVCEFRWMADRNGHDIRPRHVCPRRFVTRNSALDDGMIQSVDGSGPR